MTLRPNLLSCLVGLILALVASGCGAPQAPLNDDGTPMTMLVTVDRNDRNIEDKQKLALRKEAAEYLAAWLPRSLARFGWNARLTTEPDKVKLGPGVFLAVVTITKYTPGSAAAREAGRAAANYGRGHIAVGGIIAIIASRAKMRVTYRVYDETREVVAKESVWRSSSRNWQTAVANLSIRIAEELTDDMD